MALKKKGKVPLPYKEETKTKGERKMKKRSKLKAVSIVITVLLGVFSIVSTALLIEFGPNHSEFVAGTVMALFAELVLSIAVGIIIWALACLLEKKDNRDGGQ